MTDQLMRVAEAVRDAGIKKCKENEKLHLAVRDNPSYTETLQAVAEAKAYSAMECAQDIEGIDIEVIVASVAAESETTTCPACNGHGLIGWFLRGEGGGYDSEICPDCGGSGKIVESGQQEPVAWLYEGEDPKVGSFANINPDCPTIAKYKTSPLYAKPQPAIPPGYKLVPIEPTEEMYWAIADGLSLSTDYDWFCGLYRDMLAAAPEPKGE